MKKIKVLQVPIRNSRGGITHYAMNNWEHIDKNRFQFDYVTFSKKLDFETEITSQGCKVHYVSCYAEENEKQFIKEMNAILSQGYDVVHIHTSYWKSFLIEQLAIKNNIFKIIVHAHSTMIDEHDDKKRQEALRLHEKRKKEFNTSMATHFCACSRLAADWLFGPQIPREQIKILPNAIDVNKFQYDIRIREIYRKKLGIENSFVVGHVGRMVYQKNHEFLLNAFSEVIKQVENAVLLLVGDGVLEENIRTQAYKMGLDSKVIFLGKRNDTENLYQAMDVFCLPSRFEGLPIVLIEAQTAGLKCITSVSVTNEAKVTNNIELLPLEAKIWSNKIIDLSHGYIRRNMNHEIARSGYNINVQIKELERYYED